MNSVSVSGGTIAFSDREVRSVDYRDGTPFVWVILDDGTQINIPLNCAQAIALKLEQNNMLGPRIR